MSDKINEVQGMNFLVLIVFALLSISGSIFSILSPSSFGLNSSTYIPLFLLVITVFIAFKLKDFRWMYSLSLLTATSPFILSFAFS